MEVIEIAGRLVRGGHSERHIWILAQRRFDLELAARGETDSHGLLRRVKRAHRVD
jgi:hypothetical protein